MWQSTNMIINYDLLKICFNQEDYTNISETVQLSIIINDGIHESSMLPCNIQFDQFKIFQKIFTQKNEIYLYYRIIKELKYLFPFPLSNVLSCVFSADVYNHIPFYKLDIWTLCCNHELRPCDLANLVVSLHLSRKFHM